MTSIPNELNITINTSVPGFQRIVYKPSMTIKDISKDEKSIRFNPLIRLNQDTVDKIPENLRKKQFFNVGLFQSLLNYINATPYKNLVQATNNGTVDNNIRVTLNTLFPENSVIYIGKKPYVIADVQWSNGDWKIDTKKKVEEFDPSKITDPQLYQSVVKDEIISGEEQLQTLPSNLIYGPSYVGPLNTASGLKSKGVTTSETTQGPTQGPPPQRQMLALPPVIQGPTQGPSPQSQMLALPPAIQGPTQGPPQSQMLVLPPAIQGPTQGPPPQSQTLALPSTAQGPSAEEPINTYEIISETTTPIQEPTFLENYTVEPQAFIYSRFSTSELRKFFKDTKFYFLINEIFKSSPNKTRNFVEDLIQLTSNVNIQPDNENLSLDAYKESVNSISVISNSGGGDCFFIAVADAINYYNFNNQKNRIISNKIQGTGKNSYTPLYLRNLVYEFINLWEGFPSFLKNIAPNNVSQLNEIFRNTLKEYESNGTNITQEEYLKIAKSIYVTHDNFCVEFVNSVPEPPTSHPVNDFDYENSDYYNPFKIIQKNNIKDYILSNNYWANEIAIMALSSKLKLNVIVIEKRINAEGRIILSTPVYTNFSKQYNKWFNYLFLYYYDGHYELVTFNYIKKVPKIKNNRIAGYKNEIEKKIIFHKKETPPVFIIFIIFGSFYSSIKQPVADGFFTFREAIMKALYNIISVTIYRKPIYPYNLAVIDNSIKTFFYPTFIYYFPNSKIPKSINRPETESEATQLQLGGAKPYYRPYYRPYVSENLVKKDDDKSKISYYITIDMELHPGTSITPEELKNIKCRQKWNAVRKAYARFIGKPYVIPPVYETKTLKNNEKPNTLNKTQKERIFQNNTRNNRNKKGGFKSNRTKRNND